MSKSVKSQIEENQECEFVLDCLFGLNQLDKECYMRLLDVDDYLTVSDLSEMIGKDNSTIHRSLDRLVEAGLITKEQKTYESGGYTNVYTAVNPEKAAERMRLLLHQWYVQTGNLVSEFEQKYNQ